MNWNPSVLMQYRDRYVMLSTGQSVYLSLSFTRNTWDIGPAFRNLEARYACLILNRLQAKPIEPAAKNR